MGHVGFCYPRSSDMGRKPRRGTSVDSNTPPTPLKFNRDALTCSYLTRQIYRYCRMPYGVGLRGCYCIWKKEIYREKNAFLL
ncbi:hypothetical protein CEXT_583691 [Caerostris extrusa]|uniref:Uncharacterized protein n=1 Tax=Caerostris extrusa TaxID=172846 RepID=A0AAV4SL91_CAEEX|nr:hypothetical protein CEXT_583691 [Caerostris extrusa]